MDPSIWGPPLWKFLHLVSIHYPHNPDKLDKTQHKQFLTSLNHILPCPVCADHYKNYMTNEKIDLALKGKKNYMKLIWNLHNDVNARNGTKILKYEEFIRLYKNMDDKNMDGTKRKINNKSVISNQKENISFVTILLIIILLLVMYISFVEYKLKNSLN